MCPLLRNSRTDKTDNAEEPDETLYYSSHTHPLSHTHRHTHTVTVSNASSVAADSTSTICFLKLRGPYHLCCDAGAAGPEGSLTYPRESPSHPPAAPRHDPNAPPLPESGLGESEVFKLSLLSEFTSPHSPRLLPAPGTISSLPAC